MGYDMRIVDDPTDRDLYNKANAEFHAACQRRDALPESAKGTFDPDAGREFGWDDERAWVGRSPAYSAAQDEVHMAYRQMRLADVGYFCLNIWGMQIARVAMKERGMVHTVGNHPAWPEPDSYEIPPGVEPWDDEGDDLHPAVVQYRRDVEDVLCYATPDVPGMAIWKFGSNDDWLVTPIEIKGALAMLERSEQGPPLHEGEPIGWWDEWIAWLRLAAEHGGFRVR